MKKFLALFSIFAIVLFFSLQVAHAMDDPEGDTRHTLVKTTTPEHLLGTFEPLPLEVIENIIFNIKKIKLKTNTQFNYALDEKNIIKLRRVNTIFKDYVDGFFPRFQRKCLSIVSNLDLDELLSYENFARLKIKVSPSKSPQEQSASIDLSCLETFSNLQELSIQAPPHTKLRFSPYLTRLTFLKESYLTKDQFQYLHTVTNLKSLILLKSDLPLYPHNLIPFFYFTNLTELDLSQWWLRHPSENQRKQELVNKDISFLNTQLAKMTNLRYFSLPTTRDNCVQANGKRIMAFPPIIQDKSLSCLTNLESLMFPGTTAYYNPTDNSISCLTKLKNLSLPYVEEGPSPITVASLSKLTHLTNLNGSVVERLTGEALGLLTKVKRMTLDEYTCITLDDLRPLVNLRGLGIDKANIAAHNLKNYTNLRTLILSRNSTITDDDLKNCTNLHTLVLSGSPTITDNCLDNLLNLTNLAIYTDEKITGSSFAKLTNLTELTVKSSKVRVDNICQLSNLIKLSIEPFEGVNDFYKLFRLPNLKALFFDPAGGRLDPFQTSNMLNELVNLHKLAGKDFEEELTSEIEEMRIRDIPSNPEVSDEFSGDAYFKYIDEYFVLICKVFKAHFGDTKELFLW